MRNLEKLRDNLCHELDAIAEKREMTMSDLEKVDKMTSAVKNLYKIEMYEGGYSGDGNWEAMGTYARGGSYGRTPYETGSSYTNRGEHYVRGHYSRDGHPDRDSSERDRMTEYREGMNGRW